MGIKGNQGRSVLDVLGPCPCWACWGCGVFVLPVLDLCRVRVARVAAVLEPPRGRVGRAVLGSVLGNSRRVGSSGVRVSCQRVVSCCIFGVLVFVSCRERP